MSAQLHKRKTCRVCGNSNLRLVLSLGSQPLANAFLSSREEFAGEARYPLDVYLCETCSLVQLLDVIDPGMLFSHYLYLTGASETMEHHHAAYAGTLVQMLALERDDLVVEVGSNDGSLLEHFQRRDLRVLGIDPASNIAELANKRGIQTLSRFFSPSTAAEVRQAYGEAKVVLANNVLAHVDDVQGFVEGCMHLLNPTGLLVVEVPYLRRLIEKLEYDTIYHEHLCYFSATALARLCGQLGLSIVRADEMPVHGGSLRLYIGREEHHGAHGREVLELLETEQAEGLTSQRTVGGFANRVAANRRAICQLLHDLAEQGKTLAGYGAPAKATTLLNYCGIGPGELPYLVDKNPWKVGRYQPGTGIPVLGVETLLEREPDYVLILPWNLQSEVVEQQREYAQRGGRGTRLAEETSIRPKPIVEIGDKPILWHLMNIYSHYGHKDFLVACGYKGEMIKEYFHNFFDYRSDYFVDLRDGSREVINPCDLDWRVGLIDTGPDTMTGGRILRLKPWVQQETFMVTYGDALGDIDIARLTRFHRSHGALATVTAVRPPARFGALALEGDTVREFSEKPQTGEGWINGGFFVFEAGIFDYLKDDRTILERDPLERLAEAKQLRAYRHEGFWQPMDTLRDKQLLESLWAGGSPPWKIWK